jgi:hypothetical protein
VAASGFDSAHEACCASAEDECVEGVGHLGQRTSGASSPGFFMSIDGSAGSAAPAKTVGLKPSSIFNTHYAALKGPLFHGGAIVRRQAVVPLGSVSRS